MVSVGLTCSCRPTWLEVGVPISTCRVSISIQNLPNFTMTSDELAEEYLRWRFESMKAEAPTAPSAAQLIERALPWWESRPERFRALVGRLEKMQGAYDHNGGSPGDGLEGHAIPVLIVRGDAETEGFARVLDFKIRDGRLHFRFQSEPSFAAETSTFEVTFISCQTSRALLFTRAYGSNKTGYIGFTELPSELARDWALLTETDRLPFRLILRSGPWA